MIAWTQLLGLGLAAFVAYIIVGVWGAASEERELVRAALKSIRDDAVDLDQAQSFARDALKHLGDR